MPKGSGQTAGIVAGSGAESAGPRTQPGRGSTHSAGARHHHSTGGGTSPSCRTPAAKSSAAGEAEPLFLRCVPFPALRTAGKGTRRRDPDKPQEQWRAAERNQPDHALSRRAAARTQPERRTTHTAGARVHALNRSAAPRPGQDIQGRMVVVTATIWGVAGTELKPNFTGGSIGCRAPRSVPSQLAVTAVSDRMDRTP